MTENQSGLDNEQQPFATRNINSPTPSIEQSYILLWRRLLAAIIDLTILMLMIRISAEICSGDMVGVFLGWGGYFVIWFMFNLKISQSFGKWITLVATEPKGASLDAPSQLLLRFGITWAPLFIMWFSSFSFLQWSAVIWYLILLVALALSHGGKGLQDLICKTETHLKSLVDLPISRKTTAWIFGSILIMLEVNTFFSAPQSSSNGVSSNSQNSTASSVVADRFVVAKNRLQISAQTVVGAVKTWGMLWDHDSAWSGSACVIAHKDNRIHLVTNSHVLNIGSVRNEQIIAYNLAVQFASGREKRVLRFGDEAGSLDLAILEVDDAGLIEGEDYVTVPFDESIKVNVGDDVVAVGSPVGLSGTCTFGKISAFRDDNRGEPCALIQTDAAINHGNSGGPLFAVQQGGYKWIGVNTYKMDDANNLGFAIYAQHVHQAKYYFYSADPDGTVAAVNEHYHGSAKVSR